MLLQIVANDGDAANLYSTGIPILQYSIPEFPLTHVPEGIPAEAPDNIKGLARAFDAIIGNSTIMAQLQVLC